MIPGAAEANWRSTAASRWKVVRAWPGLSGEAKLAWDYVVMELALGRVDTTIEVSIAAVGEKYGAGDATRSGRRSCETLRDVGLVDVIDKAPGGIWTLYLRDPIPLRKARLLPQDPQRHLFDDLPDDGQALPENEQAAVAQLPPDTCKSTPTLTPDTSISALVETPQKQRVSGGSCATAADADSRDPLDVREVIEFQVLRAQQRVAEQPAEVAAIVRRIGELVNDPKLSRGLCERVAWKIVEGAYPSEKLERILHRAAVKGSAHERGRYFVGAIKGSFRDAGLTLEPRQPAPPAKTRADPQPPKPAPPQ